MRAIVFAIVVFSAVEICHASQGAATLGCDKEYPKLKASFQKLYDKGKYQEAYDELEEFVDTCDWIKDSRMYWIWSDLSLAAYKLHDAAKCLEAVNASEDFLKHYGPDQYSDPELKTKMQPPKAALSALAHNKKLCTELSKTTKPIGPRKP